MAHQVREAPAIAIDVARGLGDNSLVRFAQEAFTSGMRLSLLLGAGLLAIGALFVWLRGASRHEEIVEDELDVTGGEGLPVDA